MDLSYFAEVTALAGGAVLVVQQVLKLNFVPGSFANRYPVPTNIVLSLVGAAVVVWQTSVQPQTFGQWVVLVGTISLVAAIAYNQVLGNWKQLKAAEGPS